MDSQAAARRWAATWTAAWQAHDVEAVVALYADDAVHRSTPFRPPHRGRQAVRDYVTQAFADEQRIDEVRFGVPVVEGDREPDRCCRPSCGSQARSFRWSFHHGAPCTTGAHSLDDPSDLTCKYCTRQHWVDDPLLIGK